MVDCYINGPYEPLLPLSKAMGHHKGPCCRDRIRICVLGPAVSGTAEEACLSLRIKEQMKTEVQKSSGSLQLRGMGESGQYQQKKPHVIHRALRDNELVSVSCRV